MTEEIIKLKSKDEVQSEALKVLADNPRVGIAITVGGGKTLLSLMHIAKRLIINPKAKFLVVVPKLSVITTWKDEAVKYNLNHIIPHLTFTTYRSLYKQDIIYDIVFFDECHNLLSSHLEWLHLYRNEIVGLTGTPPKGDIGEKSMMVDTFCPIMYTYSVDSAVKDGLLNDYKIHLHPVSLDTARTLRMEKQGRIWFTSEKDTYEYWSRRLEEESSGKVLQILRIMRMKALMGFPSKTKYAKKLMDTITDKCIVFANTHEQADELCKDSYHSGNPDSEDNLAKFKAGDILKLSTVLQLNEGVNIPDLKHGIILHSYSNERKTSQRIGRLLRLNPSETAEVHILYYKNTVDEQWVSKALEDFDQKKITIY